nr:MAG TPA: helix-turn-helix domain protein [Caudoviricetes sp.]
MSTSKRNPLEPLYTVREVADRYSVQPRTIREWVNDEKFKGAVKLTQKRILIPESALRAFEDALPRFTTH